MKKVLDFLKSISIILVLIGLIIVSVSLDYTMFKHSHPTASYIEYLWERSHGN